MPTKDVQPKLSKWKSFKIPRVHNDEKGYWYLATHEDEPYTPEPERSFNIPLAEQGSDPVEPAPPAPTTSASPSNFVTDGTSDISPERQRAIWEARQRAIYGDNWRDREQSI
jgi:hypothetical protein